MLLKSVQLPVDTILSYSPILHMCVSRLTIQKDSSHCAWGLGRYCPAGCHFPHGAGIGDFTTGLLAPFVAYAWYSGNLCAQRRDLVEPLWRGRSRQCCDVEGAHQRRRGRHRLPDRAHPGLWRAARVPHPLLFIEPRRRNLWVTDTLRWVPEARLAQPANPMWDSAASACPFRSQLPFELVCPLR